MELTFLGTSSMVPTKSRNHSSILISYGSEGILVDCGEGTQRQLKIAGIPLTKVSIILISHWDGDHVLGLPGLLQTLGSSTTGHKVRIFGPKGTIAQVELMKKAFLMENVKSGLSVDVVDVDEGAFLEKDDFRLEARQLSHSTLCHGYSFMEKNKIHIDLQAVKKLGLPEGPLLGQLQQGKQVRWKERTIKPSDVVYSTKGKKVTVIMDTEFCLAAVELAQDSDLLICESTYANSLEEKAREYKHLTAGQAAAIANKARVGKLLLTHFSQRYKTTEEIESDARTVFDNVACAKDFMKVRV
ncbi:TPA: ribonuclease Z [Candidatus Woesearchaeota archaeon]|nr:ribonuclease Z [Candidatus Woesearchaeota archaeon]